VLAGLDRLLDHGSRHQKDRDQGQSQLFGAEPELVGATADAAALPETKPWTEIEALAYEKEALGLYMSGHPLQRYSDVLAAAGAKRLVDLAQSEPDCAIGGVITGLRQLKTKRGDRMAVFTLEQETAKVETVVFPEAFGKYGGLVVDDAMVLVRGKFEKDDESSKLVASELVPLESVRERAVREVQIRLATPCAGDKGALRRLVAVLERYPGDRRVTFLVDVNHDRAAKAAASDRPPSIRVRTGTAHRIQPSDRFVNEVEAICGAGAVTLK
jgi:DNA polymerase-3 subunit alpha